MAKKSRRTRRSRSGKSGRKPVVKRPQAAKPTAAPSRSQTATPTITPQTPATGLKKEDYSYVIADLKRIALFASSIAAILVALSFIIK
jgi:hypothetical protein